MSTVPARGEPLARPSPAGGKPRVFPSRPHGSTADDIEPGPEPAPSEEGLIPVDKSIFASLKIRDYALLWSGMVGSAFAMNMQLVAQGWLVYEMTVSALNLAWVTLAFMVPQVAFSLVGGVLGGPAAQAPRHPLRPGAERRGHALHGGHRHHRSTFLSGISSGSGFLNGTLLALSMPARTAFIPEIVGEPLMFNAMAFNTAAWNLSRILGPGAGGVPDRGLCRWRHDVAPRCGHWSISCCRPSTSSRR